MKAGPSCKDAVRRPRVVALAAAGVLGSLLALSAPAATFAAGPLSAGTRLTLALPPPTKTGQAASLVGSLASWAGPMARAPVHLFIDGRHTLTLEAGADGSLRYRFPRGLPAGGHAIELEYYGSRPLGFAPAAASGVLTLLPMDLTLQTVPAVAGVSFSVDGQAYVTDASGRVHAPLAVIGPHQLSVAAPADTDDARYSFGRWFDGASTARRDLRVYDDRTIAVALAGAFRVPISFQDSTGAPLDRRRISDVSLVGPAGETVRVAPSQPSIWLSEPAPSIGSQHEVVRPIRYSLASASFEGVGVANHGDDAFTPGQGRPWAVKLRVYTLRVRVRQPLLGSQPEQVVVRSGAGIERSAPTNADGVAVLRQLPRDLYSVSPQGAQVAPSARVQVTRDQLIDVTSYAAVEAAMGVLGLVLVTLGACALALLVRRRLRPLWTSARAHLGGRVLPILRGDETE